MATPARTPGRVIAGLSEVRERYDLLLCDVWGVIHNGREAFAGPCAALARWRRDRGPVMLISNSPRPAPDVAAQMDELGVPRACWSELVTSGDATRDLLAERAPGPVWHLGPPRDAPLYEGLGLDFAGPGQAVFITCTGLFDDETEGAEDYRGRLAEAAARGLEMVCANPDRIVQRGDRLIPCAGALADLYETLGGRVVMAGKPFAPIYALTLARAARMLDRPVDRRRVLAVGDGPATDIAGAQARGLDTLFVASGIHGGAAAGEAPEEGSSGVSALEAFWPQGQPGPTFVMDTLAW